VVGGDFQKELDLTEAAAPAFRRFGRRWSGTVHCTPVLQRPLVECRYSPQLPGVRGQDGVQDGVHDLIDFGRRVLSALERVCSSASTKRKCPRQELVPGGGLGACFAQPLMRPYGTELRRTIWRVGRCPPFHLRVTDQPLRVTEDTRPLVVRNPSDASGVHRPPCPGSAMEAEAAALFPLGRQRWSSSKSSSSHSSSSKSSRQRYRRFRAFGGQRYTATHSLSARKFCTFCRRSRRSVRPTPSAWPCCKLDGHQLHPASCHTSVFLHRLSTHHSRA
jgi:hypothetical protein